MKKTYLFRGLFYIIGLLVLALGITLNTKTGLGVTAIISVSYSISTIGNLNFGNITLALYGLFVMVEMALHVVRTEKFREREEAALGNAGMANLKLVLLMDVLQFPLSLVFTRFLNLFADWIPDLQAVYGGSFAGSFGGRVLFLIIAIILTGAGSAMSLNMRLIPNPGDGIVQAIADCTGKKVGFTKNCFDVVNISITITVGMVFVGKLVGVGLGTVLAVIGVGRVIALFNYLFMEKMARLAGMPY